MIRISSPNDHQAGDWDLVAIGLATAGIVRQLHLGIVDQEAAIDGIAEYVKRRGQSETETTRGK